MSDDRVRAPASGAVQDQVDREARRRVQHQTAAPCDELTAHLNKLDREWEVKRALEVNASSLILLHPWSPG
ncbi:hypothetical protein [Sanguibacter sp. 25GB23B1]|uniref:hypothetical protein n=1 Tax=unclassified Sanguibacter TaxID=2645534 RepID=UPI0032B02162